MLGPVEDWMEPPTVDNRYCATTTAVTEWGDETWTERNALTALVVERGTEGPPSVA
jgi:hypothetical protein